MLEVQSSEIAIESVSSLLDEGFKSFSVLFDTFLVSTFETSAPNGLSYVQLAGLYSIVACILSHHLVA